MGIEKFAPLLRGMFSFIIFDKTDRSFYAVRDHVGITPLYIGYGADGSIWFASEMKALAQDCARFEQFLPGHYYSRYTNAHAEPCPVSLLIKTRHTVKMQRCTAGLTQTGCRLKCRLSRTIKWLCAQLLKRQ
jgi:asparagine synthetase B (glutamine-hydrolysing)